MNITKTIVTMFLGVLLAMLLADGNYGREAEFLGMIGVLLSGAVSMFYALESKLERLYMLESAYSKLWNKKGEI